MKTALIGLPGSGKTTLHNSITGGDEPVGTFDGTPRVRPGVVAVPDERIDFLCKLYDPKKTTPATFECLDITGMVRGQGTTEVSPQILGHLRELDALIHVIQAFDSPDSPHPLGRMDPGDDLARVRGELIFADFAVAEKRVAKLASQVNKPTPHQEEDRQNLELMQRVLAALEEGIAVCNIELTDEEIVRIKHFQFLTMKPEAVVFNIGEGDEISPETLAGYAGDGVPHLALSAQMEMEIAQLPLEDRAEFLEALGVTEPAAQRMIRLCYEMLGLLTFFTAGPPEVHALMIRRGTNAQDAARKIHSDIGEHFIRAEIVSCTDLQTQGDLKNARSAGKLRTESRGYIMQDGDVINVHHDG